MRFNHGDILVIKAHTSQPGKGLTYPDCVVTAYDSGCAGGWDVWDVIGKSEGIEGQQMCVYGFSIMDVRKQQAHQEL